MTAKLLGKRIGIAFGGYVPLHSGHLDLIEQAIRENDGCIIVVGGTEDPDERGVRIGLPVHKRYEYVCDYFADNPNVRVVECNETKLGIQTYPNGWDSWMQWSQPLIHELAPHAAVFTWYSGESNHEAELKKRFAQSVQNEVVIVERTNPISGTKIRENPEKHLDQVAQPFQATFQRKRVGIFCASSLPAAQYVEPATVLVRQLAEKGYDLIYGGSDYGLMKVVADMMQAQGASIYGVTIPVFAPHSRKNATHITVVDTLAERKQQIFGQADAIIALVGGLGTLDEVMEAIELKRQGELNAPIFILNTAGFYNGLKEQFARIAREQVGLVVKNGTTDTSSQMSTNSINSYVTIVDTPEDILQSL